ncbi:UNVERIFIED_CONTAM: hypothetical protein Sindi_2037900 [Sesamum indicum]
MRLNQAEAILWHGYKAGTSAAQDHQQQTMLSLPLPDINQRAVDLVVEKSQNLGHLNVRMDSQDLGDLNNKETEVDNNVLQVFDGLPQRGKELQHVRQATSQQHSDAHEVQQQCHNKGMVHSEQQLFSHGLLYE